MHLHQFKLAAFFHQRAFHRGFVPRELVANRALRRRLHAMPLAKQILDDACVAPGENLVHVAHGLVKPVVRGIADRHDGVDAAGDFTNALGQGGNFLVGGDGFGILDAQFVQRAGHRLVNVNTGDNQRPKKIALSTFVDAKSGLKLFWLRLKFVAEGRLAEHLRLEGELDKLARAFALREQLAALVPGDGEARTLEAVKGMRHIGGVKIALGQDSAQRLRLLGREFGGVAGHQAEMGSPAGSTHLSCSRMRSTRLSTASASGMLNRTGSRPT